MQKLHRKSTRLSNFNYSSTGYYFITTCTYDHVCTLSKIVGEGSSLPQVYDRVKIELTEYGHIVENAILKLSCKYNNIEVVNYVVMPNHVHMIIQVTETGRENPSPTTISNIMGYFKYETTKQINKQYNDRPKKIWQRGFHDHVIRNEKDYERILQYIINNPLKWQLDKYYK